MSIRIPRTASAWRLREQIRPQFALAWLVLACPFLSLNGPGSSRDWREQPELSQLRFLVVVVRKLQQPLDPDAVLALFGAAFTLGDFFATRVKFLTEQNTTLCETTHTSLAFLVGRFRPFTLASFDCHKNLS
jgi:hypothetical protein